MAVYDGFISYSHAKDRPIASALQSAIQKLGKPWYQRRALRLFRDDTSLSATPHMWPTIEQALGQSRFFLLLASPEAAASKWVNKEVAYWLDHNSNDSVLLGLTDGRLVWDDAIRDFAARDDQGVPLPPALGGRFYSEPRWVDLRPYREGADRAASKRDAKFTELAADFAAAIRGMPKEDLLSQEVRQQRRALRLAVGSAAALFVLAVAAAIAGMMAYREQQEAIVQRKNVEVQRDHAEYNQAAALTALSFTAVKDDPTRAVKLALAAWPRREGDRTPELPVTLHALGVALPKMRERKLLRGHTDAISSIAFSPDGLTVLTASEDHTARTWDIYAGVERLALVHEDSIKGAIFSPNGARILTIGKGAYIWDAKTGKKIADLAGAESGMAVFSADGKRIAVNTSRVEIWDAEKYTLLTEFDTNDPGATCVALSPDGTLIAIGYYNGDLEIFEIASKTLVATFHHTQQINSIAFSSDQKKIISASNDNTAVVWDLTKKAKAFVLRHHSSVGTAAISSDGNRYLTGSFDKTARVWDAATGEELVRLLHEKDVTSAQFSPDGARILTTAYDHFARLYDAASGVQLALFYSRGRHTNDPAYASSVEAVFSPNGNLVATGADNGIAQIWDSTSEKTIGTLPISTDVSAKAVFSANATKLASVGGWDKDLTLWNVANGSAITSLKHERPVINLVFSADGSELATSMSDANVAYVWDVDAEPPALVAELDGHTGTVDCAAFSPEGKYIVTGSYDGTARVWNARSGNQIALLKGHSGAIYGVSYSRDGTSIVTASQDTTAAVFDSKSGERISILRGHQNVVTKAAFSPNGKEVVTASKDLTARLWDADSGTNVAVLDHNGEVTSAEFSPDGKIVVTASADYTAKLWDAATGRLLTVLQHSDAVSNASFSPDGTRIVTSSNDNTLRLWDAATGQILASFSGLGGSGVGPTVASFAGNSLFGVSPIDDRGERLWRFDELPKGNILQLSCARLPDRDLADIAHDYGFAGLPPICAVDPPVTKKPK
jgi:WD40 repeat protein